MSAPRRPWLLRLAFGLGACALALGAGELGLRTAYGPPPPAVPVFTAVGETASYFRESGGMVGTTYQFASPEPPFPTRSDVPRVAFLGGSSVHGGVKDLPTDKEFPALVEGLTGVETLNLASPSLDSHDIVRMVEELVRWDFAAIVFYGGHNDFGNIYFNSRYAGATAGVQARAQSALEHLQMYVLLRAVVRTDVSRSGNPPNGRNRGMGGGESVSPAQVAQALEGFEANLGRMAWLARQHGIPLLLGTPASCLGDLPTGRQCDVHPCAAEVFASAKAATNREEQARLLMLARDIDPVPLRAPTVAIEAMRRIATAEGAILVDPVADLPRDAGGRMADCDLFWDDIHLEAAGHEAMARLFAPAVTRAVAR